jgi:hypothetical protein
VEPALEVGIADQGRPLGRERGGEEEEGARRRGI